MAHFENDKWIIDPLLITDEHFKDALRCFTELMKTSEIKSYKDIPDNGKWFDLFSDGIRTYRALIRHGNRTEWLIAKGIHDAMLNIEIKNRHFNYGKIYYHMPNQPFSTGWLLEKEAEEQEPPICNIRCSHCGGEFKDIILFGENNIKCKAEQYKEHILGCGNIIHIEARHKLGEKIYGISCGEVVETTITGYSFEPEYFGENGWCVIRYETGDYRIHSFQNDDYYKSAEDAKRAIPDETEFVGTPVLDGDDPYCFGIHLMWSPDSPKDKRSEVIAHLDNIAKKFENKKIKITISVVETQDG